MYIIKIEPSDNGSRPPMQTWLGAYPEGYALVPDDMDISVFYEHNGFVELTVSDDNILIAMTTNIEAWEAWQATIPDEPDPETDDVESRIWAAMAAAIEEGVNSLDG